MANEGWHNTPVRVPLGSSVRVRGLRKQVVREHHPVADKYLVLDRYSLADKGMRGDLAASADPSLLLDLDEGADLRAIAYGAAV